jgi:hypothetical protein
MGAAELRTRLQEFDRAVGLVCPGRSFELVLVGGGAMVLMGCLARATSDLDALRFPAELLDLMEQYDLNGRVLAYQDQFAYHYEDRLVQLDAGTKNVECFTASLEDIVASKLYSNRRIDGVDVRRKEVLTALDWDLLAAVVADMERSKLIERRYREFLENYRAYRDECGPCDI